MSGGHVRLVSSQHLPRAFEVHQVPLRYTLKCSVWSTLQSMVCVMFDTVVSCLSAHTDSPLSSLESTPRPSIAGTPVAPPPTDRKSPHCCVCVTVTGLGGKRVGQRMVDISMFI